MIIAPTPEKRHRLFECTTKPLDAFIRPKHRLREIDARLDFGKLAAPLLRFYEPDQGRPAIHPEILVRAILLGHLYAITSFRRLCDEINENLAFRWFCYLGLEDEVFDHSTISVFLERVGPEGFKLLLAALNHELASAGLLATEAYADSSLVPANVSMEGLSFSSLSPEEFTARATEENGLFVTTEVAPDRGNPKVRRVVRRYFQDRKGRLELKRSDLDARWRTQSRGKKARLSYKQHVIVDRGGFILAQEITHASEVDVGPTLAILRDLPVSIQSFTADTGYSQGKFRRTLARRGIQAFIPVHPRQLSYRVHNERFTYHGDHLVCSQGKVLNRSNFDPKHECWSYVARQRDCQACAMKQRCLHPKSKRRSVQLTQYYGELQAALRGMKTARFRRAMVTRKTVVEGVLAHLDRLAFSRVKRRGLSRVRAEGFLVAFAHNVLKMVTIVTKPRSGALAATPSVTIAGSWILCPV